MTNAIPLTKAAAIVEAARRFVLMERKAAAANERGDDRLAELLADDAGDLYAELDELIGDG